MFDLFVSTRAKHRDCELKSSSPRLDRTWIRRLLKCYGPYQAPEFLFMFQLSIMKVMNVKTMRRQIRSWLEPFNRLLWITSRWRQSSMLSFYSPVNIWLAINTFGSTTLARCGVFILVVHVSIFFKPHHKTDRIWIFWLVFQIVRLWSNLLINRTRFLSNL